VSSEIILRDSLGDILRDLLTVGLRAGSLNSSERKKDSKITQSKVHCTM
jgi:hypothetical protein